MTRCRLLLAACAALQPVVLSGCVAAVVPVVAGSVIAKKQIDRKQPSRASVEVVTAPEAASKPAAARERRREERVSRKAERAAEAPRPSPQLAAASEPLPQRLRPLAKTDVVPLDPVGGSTAVQLTGLTALPAPGSAPGVVAAPFPVFARFALTAAQPKPGQPYRSALIDPATLTTVPARPNCGDQPPAVLIDLDPGKGSFDLDNPPAPAPGLAEQLGALRAAGLTVLWQASLPAGQSERLYNILAATGLDTDRTDRLLLLGKPDERKQARRHAAARDWCIVAIAGDSKGDFEEAFDYLRDPNGVIATALSANLGDGWFLTPPPIS